jgi:signal transduction histidine kinase
VLDFSRIEAGKLELERIRFSPMRIVGHVGSLMAEIARCKRVRLTVRCSGEVPTSVLGDPERLKQCLFNLLSNACKVRGRCCGCAWRRSERQACIRSVHKEVPLLCLAEESLKNPYSRHLLSSSP